MELIDYSTSLWSVVPAALALLLAIITRRVILSLSVGIIVGSLMLADFSIINAIKYLSSNVLSLAYNAEDSVLNYNNINIILFLFLLGILTALLTVSGSNRAFAEWAQNVLKVVVEQKLWLLHSFLLLL